jgi:hypothetical protein
VCADNINKKTEVLRVARQDIGLYVKADKSKYMVISKDKNAAQN